MEDDEGREDDTRSGTHAGSDLDLDIDGDVNVALEPQSSNDFVVDTIGSGKVLSPIARQGRARRRVPPMVVTCRKVMTTMVAENVWLTMLQMMMTL